MDSSGLVRDQRVEAEPPVLRVVIPAHNEAVRVGTTITDFCEFFGSRAKIVVVANGCSDSTADIVREKLSKHANLELISIPSAIGKGGAVRVGLHSAREPFVAFADADGSVTAAQIESLLQICEATRFSGIIGSRWMYGSKILLRQPFHRRLISRAFNLLSRLCLGLPYSDTQCGAKVFSRDALREVLGGLELANFAFDIDLLYVMKRKGFTVVESPITWTDRPIGTKVKVVKTSVAMFLGLLRLRFRYGVLRDFPLCDLLARSAVIPVKGGLHVLVISNRSGFGACQGLDIVVKECESLGHTVRSVKLSRWVDLLQFGCWYLRDGHNSIDAIVIDRDVPFSWLVSRSLKPKVVLPCSTFGMLLADDGSRAVQAHELINDLISSSHYRLRFAPAGEGWELKGATHDEVKFVPFRGLFPLDAEISDRGQKTHHPRTT